jgi:hypothetical protein
MWLAYHMLQGHLQMPLPKNKSMKLMMHLKTACHDPTCAMLRVVNMRQNDTKCYFFILNTYVPDVSNFLQKFPVLPVRTTWHSSWLGFYPPVNTTDENS